MKSLTSSTESSFPDKPRRGKIQPLSIVSNQQIANNIWEMVIQWDDSPVQPGSFLEIIPNGNNAFTLRRPISITDVNSSDSGQSSLTMLYRVVGSGTVALSKLVSGEKLNVLGPLGHGFPLPKGSPGNQLLIGGGIGIPPLYYLAKILHGQGHKLYFQLGLKSKTEQFWADKFTSLGAVDWATDDGSFGLKGNVSKLPSPILDGSNALPFQTVYSCGPLPMLRWVKEKWSETIPTYCSFEERMACGVGACYGCAGGLGEKHNKPWRVCKDGPVFLANEVTL